MLSYVLEWALTESECVAWQVAGEVKGLQGKEPEFLAAASAAVLKLFRNGAKFDPPLGLMV
jgi:hypothetical protein